LVPINNRELLYTFQGLTDDGLFYIAAVMPISHPTLPASAEGLSPADRAAMQADFPKYLKTLIGSLGAQPGASFKPGLGDLDALVAYAKAHPSARADRIGVTGFCRGGMYTLLFAAQNSDVKAAVPWYGPIKPAKAAGIRDVGPLEVAAKITAPVLGLYGEADQGIPATDVKEMEAALKAAGKTAEFILYPGAPHAFNADYRQSYRPEAAKDAWTRCVAWFNKYLKA
jgi:carboxymethylenebutenolidase